MTVQNSSNFAIQYITTKFRKTFLQTQRNLSNFNFHSHSHSQGEVHDFSGEVHTISGEVNNDLRGSAHLPSKSGYGPRVLYSRMGLIPDGSLELIEYKYNIKLV